ncbi:MAG: transcription-repair coupling factor [Phycisphaerae bacterium]|jgi:transcription-repair coupling factor (superfamily II helicase)
MFKKVLKSRLLAKAAARLRGGAALKLSGVWGSSGPLLAAAMGKLTGRTVVFLTAQLDDADAVADDIEVFTGSAVQQLPAWEIDIGAAHVNDDVTGQRLRLCNLLAQAPARRDEPVDFIVAPIMALMQPVPTPEALIGSRLALQRGSPMSPEELSEWLIDAGFEHVEQIEQQGEFARRGGIIDILPPAAATAIRVEFFGDEIESIRRFDLDSQRSTEQIGSFDLTSSAALKSGPPQQVTSLLSYLPDDAIVCMVEPSELVEVARQIHSRLGEIETAQPSLTEAITDGAATSAAASWQSVSHWLAPDELLVQMRRFARVEMYAFRPREGQAAIDMGIRSLQELSATAAAAMEELTELAATDEVWVYCENPAEQKRFEDLLHEAHPQAVSAIHTAIGHVSSGFRFSELHMVVVGHHEVFHRYAKRRRLRRLRVGRPIDSLLDLHEGDYVVHVAHGIARFQGLRTLDRDGRNEEYLTLRFADNAVLHVPAGNINLVQKYIGSRQFRPTLSKLGGASWARQKERATAAVHDLAADMLRIQAVRAATPGVSYPADTDWQKQFTQEFIYVETADQLSTMTQIDSDMSAASPMDRLLCGDVGYGKTELAMRAAFKVAEAGRQVAVLVPTTVLADQHYRTFSERFADYPFRIDVLSRFRTAGQQAQVISRLAAGQLEILIGTHRLLSKDVKFADLGLVIIDEEQRFGVEHKEHLKNMRAQVDVLTMTATPIPRTLHMALLGLRDISSLVSPPMDRRAIYTEVCAYDTRLVRQAILRELNRGGQVFFVHNRVQDIHRIADRIRGLAGEARVTVAHGQMPEGRLEETMLAFVRQEIDVLVCTTIIESGLDIPSANTIIIHDADHFGLSELHQLRGRVGRYKNRAYCYLLLPESRPVTPVAAKRLKAIEEFSDLGAGFQIAMRDLEIRGAGNILGHEQSGHIAAVGYELYCQLLEQAVRELRGDKTAAPRVCHVELGVDAFIPQTYIPSERQRMEIYRRMVHCQGGRDLEQLRTDLADAYGAVPAAVETLLSVSEIRVLAGQLGIDSIIRMDDDIVFAVSNYSAIRSLFDGSQGSVRLPDAKTVHWRLPPVYLETATLLRVLLKRLRQTAGAV